MTVEESSGWRSKIKNELKSSGVRFLDPTDRYCDGSNIIQVVEADKKDVESSDLIVVNYLGPSVGTSMEMLYAYNLNIPIATIIPYGVSVSPWLTYLSDFIMSSVDEVIEFLKCDQNF